MQPRPSGRCYSAIAGLLRRAIRPSRSSWLHAILIVCVLGALAAPARAFVFRLEPVAPTQAPHVLEVGEIARFDVVLDTEGESGITGFSVGIAFDDDLLRYRPDLSEAAARLLPSGLRGQRGLVPFRNPPRDVPDFVGLDRGQVRIEFITLPSTPSEATATRAWAATIAFEAIAVGETPMEIGLAGMFDSLFTVIEQGQQVDISERIGAEGSTEIRIVPEPSTALLVAVGLGLFGLGLPGDRTSQRTRRAVGA